MGDTAEPDDSADEVPGLPEWVEQRFAAERAYWRALREGGAASETELWESCRRQWGGSE